MSETDSHGTKLDVNNHIEAAEKREDIDQSPHSERSFFEYSNGGGKEKARRRDEPREFTALDRSALRTGETYVA